MNKKKNKKQYIVSFNPIQKKMYQDLYDKDLILQPFPQFLRTLFFDGIKKIREEHEKIKK